MDNEDEFRRYREFRELLNKAVSDGIGLVLTNEHVLLLKEALDYFENVEKQGAIFSLTHPWYNFGTKK